MSDPDWDHIEDLAEKAMLADQTVISGYDFGAGFKAGYLAHMTEDRQGSSEFGLPPGYKPAQ